MDRTEIRIEVPVEETYVLDGVCQATGKNRTEVVRELLRDWSEKQLHVATIVVRMAGRNPTSPEKARRSPETPDAKR